MGKLAAFTFTTLTLFLAFALLVSSEDCVQIIYLKTGDVSGAGTEARVSLKLYDAKGNSVENTDLWSGGLMEPGHNYFERNNLDVFSFKTKCLTSKVCKIKLSQDDSDRMAGWYVDYLKVTSNFADNDCAQTEFQINQWLAVDEPPYSLSVTKDLCNSISNVVDVV